VAGTIEAVGGNVTRLRPGDEVYGEVDGAFAEYVGGPADLFARKPSRLTFEQAAAVPTSANTALQGLRDSGRLRPGQHVLVNGASGGVGTFAVQLATWLGAEVTGVCGPANVDLVRSLGADHVVDYTRVDFTRGGPRYDLVLDLIGNHEVVDIRRALTARGTLVLSSGTGGRWLGPMGRILGAVARSPFVGHRLTSLMATRSRENLDLLTGLLESGRVAPVLDRTYRLDEAVEAIRYVERGHARGKVVLAV
jgi:NADPH:quinone reductase-like Zn-dependent oxidoreductase